MNVGKFVISLDFELHWGAVEKWDLDKKKDYFDTTRKSIPLVLRLFDEFGIHATWATVGFLFAKNKEQLYEFLPKDKPYYQNQSFNYYNLIEDELGNDENDDPYHYGYSLIKNILDSPNQELGTHTFCHYYCNELGQNLQQFDADLKAAQKISKANFGIELKSLVFPRNQLNRSYLDVARENRIRVIRSNPDVWFWRKINRISPFARAVDSLMPISPSMVFNHNNLVLKNGLLLLPASRFLRPFSKREKLIQALKINRILCEMTFAAKQNRSYHLWWHPHNFGYYIEENMANLRIILEHYKKLNHLYQFTSKSMIEMH